MTKQDDSFGHLCPAPPNRRGVENSDGGVVAGKGEGRGLKKKDVVVVGEGQVVSARKYQQKGNGRFEEAAMVNEEEGKRFYNKA